VTAVVGYRPATDDDWGYIVQTWGKTMRAEFPDMRTEDFAGWIRDHVKELRSRKNTVTLVGYPPDEPMIIWGWAMGRPGAVHYGYVREPQRRKGIFRALMSLVSTLPIDDMLVTHLTPDGRALKRRFGWRYIPVP
jgi:hypothetical protein